ncbi:MAG: FAD-dependent oxidoreductase [Chloroflexota bacterium]
MEKHSIVVIGAGYAGMIATLRMSGKLPSATEIILINTSPNFVERTRQHQVSAEQAIRVHSIKELLSGRPVRFIVGTVTALNPNDKTIVVKDEEQSRIISYDTLVYALGSLVGIGTIKGINEYCYLPRQSTELVPKLQLINSKSGHVAVIGGGLTGIEWAAEVAEHYPNSIVTLVTNGEIGKGLSTKGRAYILGVLRSMGIVVREKTYVHEIDSSYVQTDKDTVVYDACLWAGAFAVSSLAEHSGLAVNERGRIRVDNYMRSLSHPDVFAVGDAAVIDSKPQRMACATAMPMGAYAGDSIIRMLNNQPPKPFSFRYVLQCISLGRKRGLVQFVDADDQPSERIITGRLGAFVKEQVLKYTIWSIQWERRLTGSYQFPSHPWKSSNVNNISSDDHEESFA